MGQRCAKIRSIYRVIVFLFFIPNIAEAGRTISTLDRLSGVVMYYENSRGMPGEITIANTTKPNGYCAGGTAFKALDPRNHPGVLLFRCFDANGKGRTDDTILYVDFEARHLTVIARCMLRLEQHRDSFGDAVWSDGQRTRFFVYSRERESWAHYVLSLADFGTSSPRNIDSVRQFIGAHYWNLHAAATSLACSTSDIASPETEKAPLTLYIGEVDYAPCRERLQTTREQLFAEIKKRHVSDCSLNKTPVGDVNFVCSYDGLSGLFVVRETLDECERGRRDWAVTVQRRKRQEAATEHPQ